MTVTATSFKEVFPTFEGVDDTVVERAIARAENQLSRRAWGSRADDGVNLLTAHILEMDARAAGTAGASGEGVRGPVTSESAGPLSRSYASPVAESMNLNAYLSATSYGQEYGHLRSLVFASRVAC